MLHSHMVCVFPFLILFSYSYYFFLCMDSPLNIQYEYLWRPGFAIKVLLATSYQYYNFSVEDFGRGATERKIIVCLFYDAFSY